MPESKLERLKRLLEEEETRRRTGGYWHRRAQSLLKVEAVNALPGLLRLWEAAEKYRASKKTVKAEQGQPVVLDFRANQAAYAELVAALSALDEGAADG